MGERKDINMELGDALSAIDGQASHVEELGAPCTARVIRSLSALMKGQTRSGARIRDWPGFLLVDAVPLRIAGGLHYLHLSGIDDRLGPIYSGEVTRQEDVDAIVCCVVAKHARLLEGWFDSPPQTPEAGRSACIMAGLMWVSGFLGPQFELNEIGASAGINLMMGRFGFDLGGVRAGVGGSPMRIAPRWQGTTPPGNAVDIISACGCDLEPIDLNDPEQALRLKSYVWPDVPKRIARIDTAIAMAREFAPMVVESDALDWVVGRLAQPREEGVCRALSHSIVWQYLPHRTQEGIEQAMQAAGEEATEERPLAWVRFETNRDTFRHEIAARYWPGGEEWTLLGHAHAHGEWLEWLVK